MNPILALAFDDAWSKARSTRMIILLPLLALFILGACWGLSDPDATLPASISANTPFEVLFVASLFILLSSTLGVVLFGFDGISKDRISGVLAIQLSQPIPRRSLALSMLLGTLLPVLIPTLLLSILGIILIKVQMGEWPDFVDIALFFGATTLLLFWYATIQMYASSLAKDMGSSISLGIGAWLLFTMVWLLVTVLLASAFGVDATDTSNADFEEFSAKVDLLSPNGVYHLLLEMRVGDDISRTISPFWVAFSAVGWTVLPLWAYLRRFQKMGA